MKNQLDNCTVDIRFMSFSLKQFVDLFYNCGEGNVAN